MGLELHKVSIDYNNFSIQGHMEMCTPCFSITMPDSLDDNTVWESVKNLIKYTKEQVYRLRSRFSMLGIEKNTCKWISELGIKCRFRGRRGRSICKPQPVRNWDNNLGIHNAEELDLSFICRTWIDNDDSVTKTKLKAELLSLKGNKQRLGKGEGVGLIYRKGHGVDVLESGELASFEYCLYKITISQKHQLMVLLIYRPSYSEEHSIMVGTF